MVFLTVKEKCFINYVVREIEKLYFNIEKDVINSLHNFVL